MKKNNLFKDEDGSILLLTLGVMFILLAIIATVFDFGRYNAAMEKLQNATDAASLAAAKSAERWVKLEIDPGEKRDVCCGPFGCSECCKYCGGTIIVTGTEAELLDNNGWKDYCCTCGCGSVEILDRWVEYKNGGSDAVKAANTLFEMNKPKEMEDVTGGDSYITSIDIRDNRRDPYYPSVIVKTHGRVKTIMMDFLNIIAPDSDFSHIKGSTCSQGETYYVDLKTGKWQRPPEAYCLD
ncbi:pilus assembly protein TadG-related protein [Desulfofalx alkaliphila]|uniref:pilus assembly protein TadG-related protein n=1 Tax=Desulfofalx alkaliphila TaxID=105483 RepID=UPI0004E23466|nr:pilus assembly protein TadG-related protein [Desulfofalx alkaliphila]